MFRLYCFLALLNFGCFFTTPVMKYITRRSIRLHEDGYYIVNEDDRYYCIDFANKVILDMEHEGIDVSRLKNPQTQQEITPTQSAKSVQEPNLIQGVRKALQQRGGSKDGNREHEVGGHGNYDDIDDERKLKR